MNPFSSNQARLLEENASPAQQDLIQSITESSSELAEIIERVLDLSRLENNVLESKREQVAPALAHPKQHAHTRANKLARGATCLVPMERSK
jgi:signal transduction histidine kinase